MGDLVVDAGGALYFTNTLRHTVFKIPHYAATPEIFAGLPLPMLCPIGYQPPCYAFDFRDGRGQDARFFSPVGLAIDTNGDVLVADEGNHTIRRIKPNSDVTTLFASAPNFYPEKLVVDAPRNRMVVINGQISLEAVSFTGQITHIAGLFNGQAGVMVDGDVSYARFGGANSVAVDAAGNIFVADWGIVGSSYAGAIRHVVPGQTFPRTPQYNYSTTVRTLPLTPAQVSNGQGFTWISDTTLGGSLTLSWINGNTLLLADPTRHTVRTVSWAYP
ncbi:MAG: hypothetical protein QM817_34545 [Archangium sp.]